MKTFLDILLQNQSIRISRHWTSRVPSLQRRIQKTTLQRPLKWCAQSRAVAKSFTKKKIPIQIPGKISSLIWRLIIETLMLFSAAWSALRPKNSAPNVFFGSLIIEIMVLIINILETNEKKAIKVKLILKGSLGPFYIVKPIFLSRCFYWLNFLKHRNSLLIPSLFQPNLVGFSKIPKKNSNIFKTMNFA